MAVVHNQRPGVSLAFCCLLGKYLSRFCPSPEAVTHRQGLALAWHPSVCWGSASLGSAPALRLIHTARDLALAWFSAAWWGRPHNGSAPALRLLHTARGLALAWFSAAWWGSTLQRFCPCPEAVTHSQRPGASLALCCMLGQHLRKVLPLP